jgi:uncharacterized delta-60 repeat protein
MVTTSSAKRRVSRSVISSAIGRPIEMLESRTLLSAAGLLDTTFNLSGKQTARYSPATSDGVSVSFQADHKAIVVGDTQNGTKDAFISRWNEDGTPDTTYNAGGVTAGANFLDLGSDEIATDVAIQSDGKAVVCGLTGNLLSFQGNFFVARYNTDGTLDTTFDATGDGDTGSKPGVRVIDFGGLDGASGITIVKSGANAGRIIVVGASAGLSITGNGIAIAFLKPDGTFDTSVGGGVGHLVTNPGLGTIEGATDVVPGPSGTFYVSGFSVSAFTQHSQFMVAQFNADGTFHTSFGNQGRSIATFSDPSFTGTISLALGVAYDPSTGKVGAAGAFADGIIDAPPGLTTGTTSSSHAQHSDFAVAQFNATTGQLDTTFSGGGNVTTTINDNGGMLAAASDVLYMNDKLVAAGGVEDPANSNNSDFATARYTLAGQLDTTWNTTGITITDFNQHSDGAFGMRLQTWDNKVYEVGHTKLSGSNGLVALVRYTPDGTPPGSGISIDDIAITEGNSGSTMGSFTVTLDPGSSGTVTVDFTTAEGTATIADNDYAITQGTLTFAPGETTKTIPVTVFGDTKVEPDETFFVKLSNPTGGATIDNGTGTATILNDDGGGVVSGNKLVITTVALGKFPNPLIGGAKNANGTATVTLKNTGSAVVNGTITVSIFASTDQAFSRSQDKQVGTMKVKLAKPLGMNQTVQVKVNVTIPKVTANGNEFLIATVAGPGVTNVNGSAVSSSTSLSVQKPTTSLVGTGVTPPTIHAHPSAKVPVNVPLKNTGNSAAVGVVQFDALITTDGTPATELFFFFDTPKSGTKAATINIAPGKIGKATFNINLPAASGNGLNHLATGSYILLVRIHSSKLNPANTTDGTTVAMIPVVVS